jgi:hypothetical protein
MYDLVDRYLRRLDQELHKFKMELEADNRGITEVLEKSTEYYTYTSIPGILTISEFFLGSLELDLPNGSSHSQKENRLSSSHLRLAERDREKERDRRTNR